MKKIVAGMFAVLATFATPAISQTAGEMKAYCRPILAAKVAADGRISFEQSFETGLCWGAMAGLQNITVYVDRDRRPLFGICAPKRSTRLQIVEIVSAHYEDHPKQAHEDWLSLALNALLTAFPCPD